MTTQPGEMTRLNSASSGGGRRLRHAGDLVYWTHQVTAPNLDLLACKFRLLGHRATIEKLQRRVMQFRESRCQVPLTPTQHMTIPFP